MRMIRMLDEEDLDELKVDVLEFLRQRVLSVEHSLNGPELKVAVGTILGSALEAVDDPTCWPDLIDGSSGCPTEAQNQLTFDESLFFGEKLS